jgi:hypothetical protein
MMLMVRYYDGKAGAEPHVWCDLQVSICVVVGLVVVRQLHSKSSRLIAVNISRS